MERIWRAGPLCAHGNVDTGCLHWPGARLVALREQIAASGRAGCAGSRDAAAVGVAARSALYRRVVRSDCDCVLWLLGASCRLARPPRVGRCGDRDRTGFRAVGATESLPRHKRCGRHLRQELRRAFHRRRVAVADAVGTCADLSAAAGIGCGCTRSHSDLEQPGMSGIPILTLLTMLPLVGAAIA